MSLTHRLGCLFLVQTKKLPELFLTTVCHLCKAWPQVVAEFHFLLTNGERDAGKYTAFYGKVGIKTDDFTEEIPVRLFPVSRSLRLSGDGPMILVRRKFKQVLCEAVSGAKKVERG